MRRASAWCHRWHRRTGCAPARCDAVRRATHRPRCKPQAKLVGPHGAGRCTVGEQVELTLLDPALHLGARAVDLLIEPTPIDLCGRKRGDDEAWVGLVAGDLGLADNAAFPAPTVERPVAEVL